MNKKNKKGQSLVEYLALTALVAIVSIGAVKVFGGKVRARLTQVTNQFDRNLAQGLKSRNASPTDFDLDDASEPSPSSTGGVAKRVAKKAVKNILSEIF